MADSSPQELDTGSAPAEVEGVKPDVPAASPATEETGQGTTLLDDVKAALAPKEKSPDSEAQGQKEQDPAPEPEPDEDPDKDADDGSDFTKEELAHLNAKTRSRLRKFKALTQQVETTQSRVSELEPQAQQFQQITNFVREAGLTTDEVNQGFDVMKALKNQPLVAYQMLKPIMDQLDTIVGNVLPPELQQQVSLGYITEEHARELARARSVASISRREAEQTAQRANAERQQFATQQHVSTVSQAVTEWERSRAKHDPDWKHKQARVTELVELEILRRRGRDPQYFPATPDEAIEISKAALKKVDEEVKRFSPKPKELKPVTDVSATRGTAKPTTMLEAARMAAAKAAAG